MAHTYAYLSLICSLLLKEFYFYFHSSAATTLGQPSRKRQDRFDENDGEIQRLLSEQYRLHKAQQDDTSSVPSATFVKQYRPSLGACKIPGRGRKQKKFSLLRTERT